MNKEDIKLYTSPVEFKETEHEYWLADKQLQGITQTLLVRALGDPYKEMTGIAAKRRDEAAQRGTNIHDDIRDLCRYGGTPLTLEGYNFLQYVEDNGWKVIANEYTVSDEEMFASQIDLLFLNAAGELCIGDFKTYSEDTAKQRKPRVTLQCSVYNWMFRLKNDYPVLHHYEIRLRGEEIEITELPMIDTTEVEALVKAYKTEDETYTYNSNPEWYLEAERRLESLLEEKTELDFDIDQLKADMMARMKKENLSSLKNRYSCSIVKGRVTQKVDTKKFEEEHPEKAIEYQVMTFDEKGFKAAAKKDDELKAYITETVGAETLRFARREK